jgi:hypothetical protein
MSEGHWIDDDTAIRVAGMDNPAEIAKAFKKWGSKNSLRRADAIQRIVASEGFAKLQQVAALYRFESTDVKWGLHASVVCDARNAFDFLLGHPSFDPKHPPQFVEWTVRGETQASMLAALVNRGISATTFLAPALTSNDTASTKLLIEMGADVNVQPRVKVVKASMSGSGGSFLYSKSTMRLPLGPTALCRAIEWRDVEFARLLIQKGADPSQEFYLTSDSNTPLRPLEYAKKLGNDNIVLLLEQAIKARQLKP